MKYTEFNIDNDKIEFANSILGNETVFVNGKKTSRIFSISGTEHRFKVDSNIYSLRTNYDEFKGRKVKLVLKKNGLLVDSRFVELKSSQTIFWVATGLIISYLILRNYSF
jgi:hypothetical protein